MEFENSWTGTKPTEGKNLKEIKLLPQLNEIETIISRTCEYFFKGHLRMDNSPFKGFILEGPPGTGKTEIVKQVSIKLDRRLKVVYFLFVDGSSIASPKWGEAENKLRKIFTMIDELKKSKANSKIIILFDDIECLMIRRGEELAKEWHYSINSILFHEIDNLDPYEIIICATTNRPQLVDEALRTRLYPISVPPLPLEQLMLVVKEILDKSEIKEGDKDYIYEIIKNRLSTMKEPTIRDARQITVFECIKNGVWSV